MSTASPQRRSRPESVQGMLLLVAIVGSMWIVEAINSLDSNRLDDAGGIYPRNVDHLWAIFTSPFLHANFAPHLLDNTIPLLFMGALIAWRGAVRLAAVTLVVIFVGGLGTWLIAPAGSITIGASGVVFGYATYLLARGLFNRSLMEIGLGVLVLAVWGGALITSVVPHQGVSWQAHVCGAVGGVVAAWLLAGRDRGSAPRARGRRDAEKTEPFAAHHEALDRALAQ